MDISFDNVSYTYQPNTPLEHQALREVSFTIQSGSFVCIAGHTGSGKSTLVQLINGLLRPTEGKVKVGDFSLTSNKNHSVRDLRKNVGIVFQYPEHQLFEETVKEDILFGPRNFGVTVSDEQLHQVIEHVGLEPSILEKSPFEISGGQKRRVAIASVLVLEPKVLILDEPTAGLDPTGEQQIMKLFQRLHREKDMTIMMITHDMEHALNYANHMLVFEQGRLMLEGNPTNLFSNGDYLETIGLGLPEAIKLINEVKRLTGLNISYDRHSIEDIAVQLSNWAKAGGGQ
ncbi:energy-coupling factor transporter ATPase [Piscibacillus halophilus]|uniref:Energy-coupling factor transporter ATP-binding protein EcfA2 n=1 Tax=Piscibacillus halophilus TaxID=571933 RepID=A0A1H9H8W0_9BACI|nr:energy-coupling factor transporter ATPase [Piscibacillus halophilus]SEQ58765.1 energy-coupling factor transport system ATP-binding protein [Piscibacillus halophilus]